LTSQGLLLLKGKMSETLFLLMQAGGKDKIFAGEAQFSSHCLAAL
jgi:hypothetical protein